MERVQRKARIRLWFLYALDQRKEKPDSRDSLRKRCKGFHKESQEDSDAKKNKMEGVPKEKMYGSPQGKSEGLGCKEPVAPATHCNAL